MRIRSFVALSFALSLVAGACSSDSGGSGTDSSFGGSGGTTMDIDAAGGTGAVGGVGGGPAGGTGGTAILSTGGTGMGANGGTGMDACAASELMPEEVTEEETITETVAKPIALYIMLDQSFSMALGLWAPAVQNLIAFVNDPRSDGLDVALQFFPPGASTCDPNFYANPEVPLGRLLGHAPNIVNALNAHSPAGLGTPIEAALRGATQFCQGFKTLPNRMPPDEDCVVVFITDGEPNGCSTDFNVIAQIAGDAWAQSQVRTYAIGLQGANFTLLDDIANRGNGDCNPNAPGSQACNISADPNGLSAALELIRDTVTTTMTVTHTVTSTLPCEWGVPAPPPGEDFDPAQVNVEIVAGGQKEKLGNVPSEAECANFSNGWYFDDPANPTKIYACPDTCTRVEDPGTVGVNVLLGCPIEIAVPK